MEEICQISFYQLVTENGFLTSGFHTAHLLHHLKTLLSSVPHVNWLTRETSSRLLTSSGTVNKASHMVWHTVCKDSQSFLFLLWHWISISHAFKSIQRYCCLHNAVACFSALTTCILSKFFNHFFKACVVFWNLLSCKADVSIQLCMLYSKKLAWYQLSVITYTKLAYFEHFYLFNVSVMYQ